MSERKIQKELQVQDNARELQICEILNLIHLKKRLGYDAEDEFGNNYELKSTTIKSVGTARDLGYDFLDKISKCYFIVAKGKNYPSGFEVNELYFLSPLMMEEWINKIKEKLQPDFDLQEKTKILLKDQLTKEEISRLEYLLNRGTTLNNPKIPIHYLETNGIRIDLNRPIEHLRELIKEHPLFP